MTISRNLEVEGNFIVEGAYITSSEAVLGQQVLIEDDVLTLKVNQAGADVDQVAGLEIFRGDGQRRPAIFWKKKPTDTAGAWVLEDHEVHAEDRRIAFGLDHLMDNNNADDLHGHSALGRLSTPGDVSTRKEVLRVTAQGNVLIDPAAGSVPPQDADASNTLFLNGNLRFTKPGLGVYFRGDTGDEKMASSLKPTLISHTHVIVPTGDTTLDTEALQSRIADNTSIFIADGMLSLSPVGIQIAGRQNLSITGGAKLFIGINTPGTASADDSSPPVNADDMYLFRLSGQCRNIEFINLAVIAENGGLVQVTAAADITQLKIHGCRNDGQGSLGKNSLSLVCGDSCDLAQVEITRNSWKRDGNNTPALLRFTQVYLNNVTIADNDFVSHNNTTPDAIKLSFRNKSFNLANPAEIISSSGLRLARNRLSGFWRFCVIRPVDDGSGDYRLKNLVFEDNRFFEPVSNSAAGEENVFISIKQGMVGGGEYPFLQVRFTGNTFSSRREDTTKIYSILQLQDLFSGIISNNEFLLAGEDAPVQGAGVAKVTAAKNRIFGSEAAIVLEPLEENVIRAMTNLPQVSL